MHTGKAKFGFANIGELKRGLKEGSKVAETVVTTMLRAVRGSPYYWSSVCTDQMAMDQHVGGASFFITMNPAEWAWEDLHLYLDHMHRDLVVDGVKFADWDINRKLAADPISVSRFIHDRFNTCFKEVILNPKGPFGIVEHFFWRVEYQGCGTQHFHIKLWVKDAPIRGIDPDDAVAAFIDNTITCRIPRATESPELSRLVKLYQMHQCGKLGHSTCLRLKWMVVPRLQKTGQMVLQRLKKGLKVSPSKVKLKPAEGPPVAYPSQFCRFGFPRRPSPALRLVSEEEQAKRGRGAVKKAYLLERQPGDEQYVNDYSSALLLAWKANIDVQYVGSKNGALTRYVTGYVAKADKNKLAKILNKVQEKATTYGTMMSVGIKASFDKPASIHEVSDKLLGLPLHKCSDGVYFLAVGDEKDQIRSLKSAKAGLPLKTTKKLEEKLKAQKIVVLRNKRRKPDGQMTRFKVHPPGPGASKAEIEQFKIDSEVKKYLDGYVTKNRKSIIPKMYLPMPVTDDDQERFLAKLMQLFVPYRKYHRLKFCRDGSRRWGTWTEAFEAADRAGVLNCKFKKFKATMEENWERGRKVMEERKAREELKKLGQVATDQDGFIDFDAQNPMDAPFICPTEEYVASLVAKLNQRQLEVYNYVMNQQRAHLKYIDDVRNVHNYNLTDADAEYPVNSHVLNKYPRPAEANPPFVFTSGVGGTGKSYLIDVLVQGLKLLHGQNVVKLGAVSGRAASLIGGVTLHSMFALPIQHGETGKFAPLTQHAAEKLRATFRGTRVIIIDEISMVSNTMLAMIERRCAELMRCPDQLFGGLTVLMFGDLLQLEPINARYCFQKMNDADKNCFQNLNDATDVWFNNPTLMYFELTENQRQKGDQKWAEMLGRIRLGIPTMEDCLELEKRIIGKDKKMSPCLASLPCDHELTKAELDQIKLAADKMTEMRDADPEKQYPVGLFSKRDAVAELNMLMMRKESEQLVTVYCRGIKYWAYAVDDAGNSVKPVYKKKGKGTRKGAQVKASKKERETAGVLEELTLCKNSRIMLVRNLHVAAGMVNGAIGTLQNVIFDPHSGEPARMEVVLDGHVKPIMIDKVTVYFAVNPKKNRQAGEGGVGMYRHQFPLQLAYGITTHKAQGMSMKTAIIDCGPSIFAKAQTYVALSRVTKLENVHLVSFAPSRIECNHLAITEYNRLRKLNNRACGLEDITEFNKHPFYCPRQNMGPLPGAQQKRRSSVAGVGGNKKDGKRLAATMVKNAEFGGNKIGSKRPAPLMVKTAVPPVKRPVLSKQVNNNASSLPPCLAGSSMGANTVFSSTVTGMGAGAVKWPPLINVNAAVGQTSVSSASCSSQSRAVKRPGQLSGDGIPPAKRPVKLSDSGMMDSLHSGAGSSSSLGSMRLKKSAAGTGRLGATSSAAMKKPSLPRHRPPSAASSLSHRLSVSGGPKHFQWPNVTNFNCYVHSALNMMACCKEAMERLEICRFLPPEGRAAFRAIVDGRHQLNVSAHLENVLLNGPPRVKPEWWPDRLRDLRMAVGGDFVHDGQQDSALFFLALVFPRHEEKTTIPLADLFQLHKRNRVQCNNCYGPERVIDHHRNEPEAITYICGSPFNRVRYGIEELIKEAIANEPIMRCYEAQCRGLDQRHKEESELFIGPSFRYLCLYIERRQRASSDKAAKDVYTDCSQDVMKIGNEVVLKMSVWQSTFADAVPQAVRFRAIGAILYIPTNPLNIHPQTGGGHYKCYQLLEDGRWRVTNDAAAAVIEDDLPEGLQGLQMIVLERIMS